MIAIVDYKAGNLTSVRLAFDAIAIEAVPTADPAVLARADRIVFPGVGAAASAMANLRATGLIDTLRARIAAGVPFLGICLGTQILFDRSVEDGGVPTLGLLPGTVRRYRPADPRADGFLIGEGPRDHRPQQPAQRTTAEYIGRAHRGRVQ